MKRRIKDLVESEPIVVLVAAALFGAAIASGWASLSLVAPHREKSEFLRQQNQSLQESTAAQESEIASLRQAQDRREAEIVQLRETIAELEAEVVAGQDSTTRELREKADALQAEVEVLKERLHQLLSQTSSSGPRRSTSKSFVEVDELFSQLELGSVAFNSPSAMTVGDQIEVSLLLAISQTVDELKKRLTAVSPSGSTIVSDDVQVYSAMRATLTGTKGLAVRSLGEGPDRFFPSLSEQGWQWEIEATKPGKQKLFLHLSAIFVIEGKERPFVLETYAREITVKVSTIRTFWGFIKHYWQWIWAVVVVPFSIWLWGVFKKWKTERKKRRIIVP